MKTRKNRKHYQTQGMARALAIKLLIDHPSHAIVLRNGAFEVIASMPYTAITRRGPAVTKEFARFVGWTKPWELFLFCGTYAQAVEYAKLMQTLYMTQQAFLATALPARSLLVRSEQASDEAHNSMSARVVQALNAAPITT